jgi:hypothetical protein
MKRHAFDPLSFIFGTAFIALAAALAIKGVDVTGGAVRWTAVGLLFFFGIVMLIKPRRSDDRS